MSNYCLALNSGLQLDYLQPHPEQIDPNDIAVALSNETRFANQAGTGPNPTVLQHTIFCYRVAKHLGWSPRLRRATLLHDAAEAYMRDIPTRLKALLPEFRVIERRVLTAVFYALGADITQLDDQRLRDIDALSGKLEAHYFFRRCPAWAATLNDVERDLFEQLWPHYLQPHQVRAEWFEALDETAKKIAGQSGEAASA